EPRNNAWSHFAHATHRVVVTRRRNGHVSDESPRSAREERRRPGPARVRAARGAHRARLRRRHRPRRHQRERDLRPHRDGARAVGVTTRRFHMSRWSTRVLWIGRDEGQDLLEYALLVALIALVCVGAIGLAGTNV